MRGYNTLFIFLAFLCSLAIVSATNWKANPFDCPAEYNFVSCTGTQLQCGIEGGTAPYCYEPSALIPLQNSTSDSGDTYQSGLPAGFILNCEETDADEPYCDSSPPTGDFWCNRNVTCYSTYHRQTRCINGTWSNESLSSECQSCRSDSGGFFACDGSITDGDGCEIQAGVSCGAGTGTIQLNECFSSSQGNCTRSSDYLDCDNDDSDSDQLTCNGVNGCEINPYTTTNNTHSHYVTCTTFECDTGYLDCNNGGDGTDADGCEVTDGGSCSVGSLAGTYNGCTCLVDKSYFETGTFIEYLTNSSQSAMLWFKNYLSGGYLINATNAENQSFLVDGSLNVNTPGNITADTGFFNLAWSYLTNIPSLIYGIWTTNNANSLLVSNGSHIGYDEQVLNQSIINVGLVAGFNSSVTDGTGGWTNDSIETNTSLNVNINSGGNLTLNGGNLLLDDNATISRTGVGTKTWIGETGNLITQFG